MFDEVYKELYQEDLAPGAVMLHGFARPVDTLLLTDLQQVINLAPFRHMVTPGGYTMSVAMSNCGTVGWITDESGYRYEQVDPLSDQNWPPMPESFVRLATSAALQAGFSDFVPDACLINRYAPKTRLSLHQDKDEKDFTAPIVSVSLGISAIFLFGGFKRSDKLQRLPLIHGDVVVWGGPSRLRYHGILPLKDNEHYLVGKYRLNLTFRKAG
ncbi:DNA oxidative demethylase AlkB [Legionella tunisiensis]|uniref:DNA oxidative demethylase AlkB n=1 Tax=Legionella tunisiensis TaxID=1034944 RepID=UPI0002FB8733|nr:DNA oxidative demethylase AlkB [Legionella tunisiensis]